MAEPIGGRLVLHRAIRTVMALVATLAAASACSSSRSEQSALPVSSGRTTSSGASQGTPTGNNVSSFAGKVLTQDQLFRAGLTSSELPSGFRFTTEPGRQDWKAAQADQSAPTPAAACRPIVDLLFGTTKAEAEVVAGWQGSNAVDVGEIKLATYRADGAVSYFASVKHAIQNCKAITYKSYVGMMNGSLQVLPTAPGAGDDSISFGMIVQTGDPHMVGYQYVRIGSSTVLISNLSGSGNTAPPPMPNDLMTAQVAKLRTAQS